MFLVGLSFFFDLQPKKRVLVLISKFTEPVGRSRYVLHQMANSVHRYWVLPVMGLSSCRLDQMNRCFTVQFKGGCVKHDAELYLNEEKASQREFK